MHNLANAHLTVNFYENSLNRRCFAIKFRLVNAFICWIYTGVMVSHAAKSMTVLFGQGSHIDRFKKVVDNLVEYNPG
jgi:hypothetical protein